MVEVTTVFAFALFVVLLREGHRLLFCQALQVLWDLEEGESRWRLSNYRFTLGCLLSFVLFFLFLAFSSFLPLVSLVILFLAFRAYALSHSHCRYAFLCALLCEKGKLHCFLICHASVYDRIVILQHLLQLVECRVVYSA